MRSRFLLVLVILGAVFGVAPSNISDAESSPDLHSSTPHAQLHSSTSGWYQARVLKEPIWIANVPGSFPDTEVYGAWNTAAGWQLIRPTSTLSGWISFKTQTVSAQTWTVRQSVENGNWYYSCTIYYPWSTVYDTNQFILTMRHEVGHCLGFSDHIDVYSTSNCDTANPPRCAGPTQPQCNQPSQPYYSAYKGIMSYCSKQNYIGLPLPPDDVYSLALYGYDGP